MYRLIAVLVAASVLSLVLLGLFVPAATVQGWRVSDGSPLATRLDIYMSGVPGGPRQTNFLSNTNELQAVVAYEGAANEQYQIRLKDLSGIVVFQESIGPLNGDGTVSRRIAVGNFVDSYKARADDERVLLEEDIDLLSGWCGNIPPVPDPWPPARPTPGPGPTPTPHPYLGWSEAMLNASEGVRSASAELTRTLRAMAILPDLQLTLPAAYDDVAVARRQLTQATALLSGLAQLLRPAAPPPPTPPPTPTPTATPAPPPQPDPQTACQRVAQAKGLIDDSLDRVAAAVNALPADTSAWRLPPTSARYANGQFAGCLQYQTELIAIVGGRPRDTAAAAALWTVGDPGPPALVFPALDRVDPSHAGVLGRSLPEGHLAIYARRVQVPNVNHQARISAFVTDRNCIPVDRGSIALWTEERTAGGAMVSPGVVELDDGAAQARLEAGDNATGYWPEPPEPPELGSWVFGCVGPGCRPGLPTPSPGQVPPDQVWARVRFEVIGTAHVSTTRMIINERERKINRLAGETAGIGVQARDRNGRSVAEGTRARVWIREGDPGLLAFDRQRLVGGRPSGELERRVLGKSADLVVGANGQTRVPPSEDPGYINLPRLYLMAGDEDEGFVTLCYQVDEAQACWEDAVQIVSETSVYLPLTFQRFDVRAEPTFLPPSGGYHLR